jgi:DNA-binding CsgD family transcriptional regulator
LNSVSTEILNPRQDFYRWLRQRRHPKQSLPNKDRDDRIVELRGLGKSNAEIAAAVSLSVNSLTEIIGRLIREGRLQRRKNNRYTCAT